MKEVNMAWTFTLKEYSKIARIKDATTL